MLDLVSQWYGFFARLGFGPLELPVSTLPDLGYISFGFLGGTKATQNGNDILQVVCGSQSCDLVYDSPS